MSCIVLDALSPAPRCLRMFLLEKRLELPRRQIDVFAGENRQPPFLAQNPAGQTPALLLDDGTCIAEAVAIMEYLEELHPEPSLIGCTALERAQARQWQRRVELNITENIHNAYHYAEGLQRFAGRIPVAPQAAAGLKRVAQDRLAWLTACWAACASWRASASASPTSGCMSGWTSPPRSASPSTVACRASAPGFSGWRRAPRLRPACTRAASRVG